MQVFEPEFHIPISAQSPPVALSDIVYGPVGSIVTPSKSPKLFPVAVFPANITGAPEPTAPYQFDSVAADESPSIR